MGCHVSKNRIQPTILHRHHKQTSNQTILLLCSENHIRHLCEFKEIEKATCIIVEPELRELRERKFKEFAEKLENPGNAMVPRERFVAF